MFVTYPDVRYLSARAPVRHPAGLTSDLRKRLIQVRNQVLRILQADREAQERAGHATHAADARHRTGHPGLVPTLKVACNSITSTSTF